MVHHYPIIVFSKKNKATFLPSLHYYSLGFLTTTLLNIIAAFR